MDSPEKINTSNFIQSEEFVLRCLGAFSQQQLKKIGHKFERVRGGVTLVNLRGEKKWENCNYILKERKIKGIIIML